MTQIKKTTIETVLNGSNHAKATFYGTANNGTTFKKICSNYAADLLPFLNLCQELKETAIFEFTESGPDTQVSILTENGYYKFWVSDFCRDLLEFVPKYTKQKFETTSDKNFTESFVLNESDILKICKAAKFVGKNELRPNMTGVFIGTESGQTMTAATDAHKMFFSGLNCTIEGRYILGLDVIKALQGQKSATIGIYSESTNLCINVLTGAASYDFNLIDENYPQIVQVVPHSESQAEIDMNPSHVIKELKTLRPYVSKINKLIKINPSEQKFDAVAADWVLNKETSKPVECRAKGTFYEFGCNLESLLAGLNVFCKSENVTLKGTGPNNGFILNSESSERVVIMPIILD
jgi:DNA polymerase III sliding clamp (beta) subunit (PCNA family)